MKYKIVADSSTDLTKELEASMNLKIAPLTLEIDGIRYVDDDDMNIHEYLERVGKSTHMPKSSCPSPEDYLSAYRGEEEGVFVITLSSELSGSYSTAVLAKDLLAEEDESKKVHVFNSRSASSGQSVIAIKVQQCIEQGMEFDEIVETVEAYIADMATIFVLEKIDHLQKAGRLSMLKATLANVLNIKLVLKANKNGEILLHSQARGTAKAIDKMIRSFSEVGMVTKERFVVVAHCQAEKRANQVKDKIEAMYDFADVIVVGMRGLSSNYANIGGIVIAF